MSLDKIAAQAGNANRRADPVADRILAWLIQSSCTTCYLFSLFSAGFIFGVFVRGWFA